MWHHTPEHVNEVSVCAWVKVCRRNRTCHMSNEDGADTVLGVYFMEVCFYFASDVYYLIFLSR
ncbi:MAG: hypothetical protein NVSMB49_23100 [Ktedonobacteraceae bacterium]